MSELKLTADSGGGSVSFKGPASTTSNAAVPFVLPVADGSAGQYLKTDGSKNLSFGTITIPTSGDNTPSWLATSNTTQAVGTGSWVQVTNLGTEEWDTDSAFASSTFTVPSGEGGEYVCFYGGYMNGIDSGEQLMMEIRVNDSGLPHTRHIAYSFAANFKMSLRVSSIVSATAGQTIKLFVYHSEGGDQNLPDGNNVHFGGYKLNGV